MVWYELYSNIFFYVYFHSNFSFLSFIFLTDAAAWAAYYSQYYGQQQAHPMQPSTGQPTLQPGVAPQPGLPSQPDANQAANQQPAAGKCTKYFFYRNRDIFFLLCNISF